MDTMKLKKMMQNIEDAFTAASFAEEGETATAQSILREERKVLLALKEGRIDGKTLKYALNTAKRIGAHLDILYVSAAGDDENAIDPALKRFESGLTTEGIRYRLIPRTGCLKQQIIDYTNSEREILFAVIESPNSLDLDCNKRDKTLSELWRKLKCPLVVVMDGAKA
jgi:hypothetical protein